MNNKSMKSQSIRNNDKGSALIVCIIVLLFVSILATVILYMAGINYRMKKAEYRTRRTFYEGEQPLERIQTNLIIPVSEALNIAYIKTNSNYAQLASTDARRQYFYDEFEKAFRDIIIKNYGGATIGTDGSALTDSTLIKNILHNLTYYDAGGAANGVDVADMVLNDGSIISDAGYAANPMGFVNTISGITDAGGDPMYFIADPSGAQKLYLCTTGFSGAADANSNYAGLFQMSVIDPATGNLYDDPKECRLLMKNVCVVVTEGGYRSIITTDIAIQMPPLDWAGGSGTPEYSSWDVYQLIHYVNWQKN